MGYSPASGVKIIEVDGKAFKSFDGSDTLLPYEDWRLPMEERAADLASRLSVDEIAGLMLYSIQNKLPMPAHTFLSVAKEKCAKESQRHGDSGKKPFIAHF